MHIFLYQCLFAIFAGIAVFSALMVVTLNNPVRCTLFLVLAFIATAGLWILAQAEFLALILVLVYVGAVMTLFLFIVMMINIDIESMKRKLFIYLPLTAVIVSLLVGLLLKVLSPEAIATKQAGAVLDLSNSAQLGMVLYTDYLYCFELAAILLLAAIISAITLAHRKPRSNTKQQDIRQQIMTSRDDRVRLVKMSAVQTEE